MIRLGLDSHQLSSLRFTVSPLMHVVEAVLRVQERPARSPVWLSERWARVPARSRATLLDLIDPATHFVPDFLMPLTTQHRPTVETELAAVAATTLEQLRGDLRLTYRLGPADDTALLRLGASPAVAESWRKSPPELVRTAWEGEPARLLSAVREALYDAWQVVVAPSWRLIRSVTETDVMYRMQLVMASGLSSSVLELVDADAWDGATAQIASPLDLDLSGRRGRIVLAPSALADRGPAIIVSGDEMLIGYPCRGRATIIGPYATGEAAGRDAGLPELLGATRHRLLAALDVPQAGHALAVHLDLSQATVSYHLARLHRSGLVERRRLGREVYYARTSAAERFTAG